MSGSLPPSYSSTEVFQFLPIKTYSEQVGDLFKNYHKLMADSQERQEEQEPAPIVITGGCLCGSVVYAIKFTEEYPWPPDKHTCQCSQCRKFTGGFVMNYIQMSPKAIVWAQAEDRPPAFTEYSHTPGNYRGFCSHCGSSLTWRSARTPDIIEIYAGTVDENWLIGNRTEAVESEALAKEGSWEENVVRKEKAREHIVQGLAVPEYRFWERNAIVGVTDKTARATAAAGKAENGGGTANESGLCVIQDSLFGLLLEGDGARK